MLCRGFFFLVSYVPSHYILGDPSVFLVGKYQIIVANSVFLLLLKKTRDSVSAPLHHSFVHGPIELEMTGVWKLQFRNPHAYMYICIYMVPLWKGLTSSWRAAIKYAHVISPDS